MTRVHEESEIVEPILTTFTPESERERPPARATVAGKNLELEDGHYAARRVDLRRAVAGKRQCHHGVLLHVFIWDLVVAKLGEELRALLGVGFIAVA